MFFKVRFILIHFFIIIALSLTRASDVDLKKMYLNADFDEIVKALKDSSFSELSLDRQLLLLECRARTGDGYSAVGNLHELLAQNNDNDSLLAAAGIVYHALGNWEKADNFLDNALTLNPLNSKALLAKAMLTLYFRNFNKAELFYEKAGEADPELKESLFYRICGNEIYDASRNVTKLMKHYESSAEYYRNTKKPDKARKIEIRLNMLKRVKRGTLYSVRTNSDKVELPIVNFAPNSYYKCLLLKAGNKNYKILLDTGNATGWSVHNPELLNKLGHYSGGVTEASTGSVEKSLKSKFILTPEVDFGDFKISDLKGIFFPKPRKEYFDANLNPIFIRDRVVTIDFINNKFVLRSKKRFDEDLAKTPANSLSKVRFYGYEWAFAPVQINGYASGLAIIETGAEDISVKLKYAQFINLPLTPKVKTFRGKEYEYHVSDIDLMLGVFLFRRPQVEIWQKRFYDTITGLCDNVVIGPWALEGKFILSFDPFDNVVVLQR
ncbi:MAG: hypothetical protein GXO77_03495 [Calditrichaeota bacterium]|nr:hypothetical protein [Calditrichota bacterium]